MKTREQSIYPVTINDAKERAMKILAEENEPVVIIRQGNMTYWCTTERTYNEYRSPYARDNVMVARYEPGSLTNSRSLVNDENGHPQDFTLTGNEANIRVENMWVRINYKDDVLQVSVYPIGCSRPMAGLTTNAMTAQILQDHDNLT